MAVGTEQRLPRLAEALLVYRMADAVSCTAVPEAEPLGGAEQEQVVVRVLEVHLDQVVIHVLARDLGLDAVEAHGLYL